MEDQETRKLETPQETIGWLVQFDENRFRKEQGLTLARVEGRINDSTYTWYLMDNGPINRFGQIPGVIIPSEVAHAIVNLWGMNEFGRFIGLKSPSEILKAMADNRFEWAQQIAGAYAEVGESKTFTEGSLRKSKRESIRKMSGQLLAFVIANSQDLNLDRLDLSLLETLSALS